MEVRFKPVQGATLYDKNNHMSSWIVPANYSGYTYIGIYIYRVYIYRCNIIIIILNEIKRLNTIAIGTVQMDSIRYVGVFYNITFFNFIK